jgi:hypothetical protein
MGFVGTFQIQTITRSIRKFTFHERKYGLKYRSPLIHGQWLIDWPILFRIWKNRICVKMMWERNIGYSVPELVQNVDIFVCCISTHQRVSIAKILSISRD